MRNSKFISPKTIALSVLSIVCLISLIFEIFGFTATKVNAEIPAYTSISGASIKYSEDVNAKTGLGFDVQVNKAYYDNAITAYKSVTVGTLIAR